MTVIRLSPFSCQFLLKFCYKCLFSAHKIQLCLLNCKGVSHKVTAAIATKCQTV